MSVSTSAGAIGLLVAVVCAQLGCGRYATNEDVTVVISVTWTDSQPVALVQSVTRREDFVGFAPHAPSARTDLGAIGIAATDGHVMWAIDDGEHWTVNSGFPTLEPPGFVVFLSTLDGARRG
jgi:alkylation response protein AidB-like acyl-CoA dehydrogenase